MIPDKPRKTLADHLVISISPILIMLLVGSLSFFLIQVFFRGEAIGSVRWVMFWFVMAIVLVSRIGIEQGEAHAAIYGAALAIATWFYLMRVHPAFMLGMLLLAIVWWCANKLVWDCTLIDDDADASGGGLLETTGERKKEPPPKNQKPKSSKARLVEPPKTKTPHSPGLWVVYFSMAALPIFGIGQMLIARGDTAARHAGFIYLFLYVAAALGLLLTTSFLGLRRYLRQQYLVMPGAIAFGWVRFGVGVAVFVLVGALLLPRPGATQAWGALRYHIDHQLHNASRFAMKFSPHGKGDGRAGKETSDDAKNTGDATKPDAKEKSSTPDDAGKASPSEGPKSPPPMAEPPEQVFHLLRILFISAIVLGVGWWVFRRRELFLQMARGFWAAVLKFFRDLFGVFTFQKCQVETGPSFRKSNLFPFTSYHSPFLTGGEESWTHEKIVLYSFEALQAWAREKGIQPRPEQTASEFCEEVGNQFPEIHPALYGLSFLYGYAAYGEPAPAKYDLTPVKDLWKFFYRGRS
jgi:hypothetical protein